MKIFFKSNGDQKRRKSRRIVWALAMLLFIMAVVLIVVLPSVKDKKAKPSYGLVAVSVQAQAQSSTVWYKMDKVGKVKAFGVAHGEADLPELVGEDAAAAACKIVLALAEEGATITVFAVTGEKESEQALLENALLGAEQAAEQCTAVLLVAAYEDANASEEARRLNVTLGKYVLISEILSYNQSGSARGLAKKGVDSLIKTLSALRGE